MQIDINHSQSVFSLRLLVIADTLREIQALSSTIGDIIRPPEIWQLREQRVVSHSHLITIRQTL